jgi:hypothetical protein
MAKRNRRGCRPASDPDLLLAQLRSPDDELRVKALHRLWRSQVCLGDAYILHEGSALGPALTSQALLAV